MLNIAVLVSGGGTNFQALIDAEKAGEIPGGRLALCVSSNPQAYALRRAEAAGIPRMVMNPKQFDTLSDYGDALIAALELADISLVILAGFLVILPSEVTERFRGRIINVHPSLIPAFCGPGFYGLKVHRAALEKGVKITGATVHFVNEIPDGGRIILQKAVRVRPGDTPELLQRRVMEEAEWELLPRAAALFCRGLIGTEEEWI